MNSKVKKKFEAINTHLCKLYDVLKEINENKSEVFSHYFQVGILLAKRYICRALGFTFYRENVPPTRRFIWIFVSETS